MIWNKIICYFCGCPIENSRDYIKDKGKNGWRFHFDCHRKVAELRARQGESRKAVYAEKFHMMIIGAEGKQWKLYP